MQYPKKMRVVTKMSSVNDEKYIEVNKYTIPHEGDITVFENGDILVLDIDKKGATKNKTLIKENEGIVDTFDAMFLTKIQQGSIAKTLGKGIATAGVKGAVGVAMTAALI